MGPRRSSARAPASARATANIRADEIDRTVAASIHLVRSAAVNTASARGARSHDHGPAGRRRVTLDGTARELHAGDAAVIPRGAVHHFVNRGRAPAIALVVFAPPLDAPDSVPVDVDSSPGAR
jgi:quercetin dioxygenase-like cupin family protein